MTEGEKAINIKLSLSLPQSFFKRKMPAPSSEGTFDGQPQGLSLRHDIEFDLIATDNSYIFANFLGGSKPPPYHVVVSAENYQISIWFYQKHNKKRSQNFVSVFNLV